jgi:hypothetical protein
VSATSILHIPPTIPHLPPALQRVPSWLDRPEAPRDDTWRSEWAEWAETLRQFRKDATYRAETDLSYRRAQLTSAAADPAYFLAVFGHIFEPRTTDMGPPGWYPWCLFPHQVIALRQLQEAWVSKKPRSDVVWEKSRDMGASWLSMGWCAHQWLFADAFSAGVISYKEDAVDNGTSKSMFFKLRGLLGLVSRGKPPGVPEWMRPEGYIPEVHGRRLKLLHPHKDCEVVGDSTTERSGTGDRNTSRFNDEASKHELFNETMDSIRATTDHIISFSSAYTKYGTDFREYARLGRNAEEALDAGTPELVDGPRYFRMEWWMHPFHTQEWHDTERAGYSSKEAFAREVLIDYKAGDNTLLYWDEAEKMPRVDEADNPDHHLMIGIDPGKSDYTAIAFANAYGDPFWPRVRWIDSYENNNKPPIFYAWLLSGIAPIPGEVGYSLYAEYLGDNEHRIMDWMLQNWLNGRDITTVMDPAGAQMSLAAMSGDIRPEDNNFPEQLGRAVFDLRERYAKENAGCPLPTRLHIRWKHLFRTNRYEPRRDNLRSVMDNSEVSKTPGGYRLLQCWQNARRKDTGRDTIAEPGIVHDDDYHLTAASEYLACHIKERPPGAGQTGGNRTQARPRGAQRERKKAA